MIVSSTSVKNAFDILMVTVLNLKITLGSVKLKNSHNLKSWEVLFNGIFLEIQDQETASQVTLRELFWAGAGTI